MTTEDHEMESVSSIGKDDDPDFTPKFFTKRSRTSSVLQAVKSPFGNKAVSPIEDPKVAQDSKYESSPVFSPWPLRLRAMKATLLRQTQERLLQRVTGASGALGVRRVYQDWCLTYFDARITQVWPSIAARVLRGVGTDAPASETPRTKIYVYEALILIAQSLEEGHETTLTDIVAILKAENIINEEAEGLAVQFVFQCLGWLTALFDPTPEPSTTRLSIQNTGAGSRRRSVVRKTIIRHPSVVIADARLPIQRLLRKFGSLLPEPECVRRPDAAGGLEAGFEDINATYVYFHNLKLLNVQIEWVDVLNQHLEFDRRNRILRIFRFPSLPRLMYRDRKGTILDRLCHEIEDEHNERSRSPHSLVTEVEDFLCEVILSYRLIFGCQRRSRALIHRILERCKDDWRVVGRYDPFLEILCTEAPDSDAVRELYSDLDAKEFEHSIPADEFPFLAPRLFDLQRFSLAQNPHSLKRLWNDKRNITAWFTTWAVIIIGGGTLVFQVLQCVFQIYPPLQKNST